MYPRYGPTGGGLLRLHSTYRHDLKIYSSDEGRVQMSAAAFTKVCCCCLFVLEAVLGLLGKGRGHAQPAYRHDLKIYSSDEGCQSDCCSSSSN